MPELPRFDQLKAMESALDVNYGAKLKVTSVQTGLQKDIVIFEERLKGSQLRMVFMVTGMVSFVVIVRFYGG